jgi:hypothetical protein
MQNNKTSSQPSFLDETAGIFYVTIIGSFLAFLFEIVLGKSIGWSGSIDKVIYFFTLLVIFDFILIKIRGKGTFSQNPFLK